MCKSESHKYVKCLCIYPAAGFGVGSRSATTSPTGSVHSTPTHQTKPNNLDPFADIGNLGGSLGGQSLELFCSTLAIVIPSICHNLCPLHWQVPASPANPPLPLELPRPSLPLVPHQDLLRHPSTPTGGSPTQEPASPRGSQVLEAVEDGNTKDRALPRSQSPAPVTPPCHTRHPRTDPITMSASLQWGEARPAQGPKHRLAWVSKRRG